MKQSQSRDIEEQHSPTTFDDGLGGEFGNDSSTLLRDFATKQLTSPSAKSRVYAEFNEIDSGGEQKGA